MPTANTESPKSHRRTAEHFRGCLLGGAAGDALGHPVEFMRIEKIHAIFGAEGIRAYPEETGGLITDDTQMTLFTAEGLLRANTFLHGQEGLPDTDKRDIVRRYVHSAYKRWFLTQSPLAQSFQKRNTDPGLLSVPEMFARRAPGRTCMSALEDTPFGHKAVNDSKGCGGVMRVAPVGLLFPPEEAFRVGCETAAITHGHKTGIYSSGFLAMLISLLVEGSGLRSAVYRTSTFMLNTVRGYEETLDAVNLALQYAQGTAHSEATVTAASGGGGWIAEDALAIGIYSAMAAGEDFERGITLAVNHSGDSDSTGSIAGQILGVMLGESAIPTKFLERLEHSEVIRNTADDLFTGYSPEASWTERYTEELPQTAKVHIPQAQEHPLPTIIGAIAGDIIGSIYELNNIKTTDFDLFAPNSYFTDDTVLTMAVADCLLNKKEFARTIWEYGRQYPGRGYGRSFKAWLENDSPELRDSYGNGSAMRVSAIGFACKTLHDVLEIAKQSAEVSHGHSEGIKGAQAMATAVFLAHKGYSKEEIKTFIMEHFKYNLDFSLDEIRNSYTFDVSCQGSVPQAIVAFLESTDFESAIRLAISIGGDSDTIASMAGAIAAAYYKEIPKAILDFVRGKLPAPFLKIIREFDSIVTSPTDRANALIITNEANPIDDTVLESLRMYGYTLRFAFDGETGLQLALDQKPDVILCSLFLSRLDGLEILKAILRQNDYNDVKFLLIAGYGGSREEFRRIEEICRDVWEYRKFYAQFLPFPSPRDIHYLLSAYYYKNLRERNDSNNSFPRLFQADYVPGYWAWFRTEPFDEEEYYHPKGNPLLTIAQIFNSNFSSWKIFLPAEDLRERKAGSINAGGWSISYKFGSDERGEFLDYSAFHRMTNDRIVRIYADGTEKWYDNSEERNLKVEEKKTEGIFNSLEEALKNPLNVTELSCRDNVPMPLLRQIGSLINVRSLRLDFCKLDSLPPEIGNLTKLEFFKLDYNNLTLLPPEIGMLENISSLGIAKNCLLALPPEIGNLTNLRNLYVYENQLTALPPEIGNLTNLRDLALFNNKLTALPPVIRNLKNLDDLSVSSNQLTALPPEIGNLTNLRKLSLDRNQLTILPPEIGNLTNLRELFLSENQLTALPRELGKLINLKHLSLKGNPINDNDRDFIIRKLYKCTIVW